MAAYDPRTKLALGVMAVIAVFAARAPGTLYLQGAAITALAGLTGMRTRLPRVLRLMWPVATLVFLMGLISYDPAVALMLTVRLANLVMVSAMLFGAVTPNEMGDALRMMKIPFGASFILTSGMRYVPLIGLKIRHIMEAQQSRGIDLKPRLRNTKNFIALLVPLLVQSFLLSDELAVAMESRGFGRKGRTMRRRYLLSGRDYLLMGISLSTLIAFVWWERW